MESPLQWKIVEYETSNGEWPITEFTKKQRPQARAKITHLIDLLEKHGSMLGMPHAKKLTTNLYELRVRGKEEMRIVYGFKQQTIYLLHAFKKQKQKTPHKDLETAVKRYQAIDVV